MVKVSGQKPPQRKPRTYSERQPSEEVFSALKELEKETRELGGVTLSRDIVQDALSPDIASEVVELLIDQAGAADKVFAALRSGSASDETKTLVERFRGAVQAYLGGVPLWGHGPTERRVRGSHVLELVPEPLECARNFARSFQGGEAVLETVEKKIEENLDRQREKRILKLERRAEQVRNARVILAKMGMRRMAEFKALLDGTSPYQGNLSQPTEGAQQHLERWGITGGEFWELWKMARDVHAYAELLKRDPRAHRELVATCDQVGLDGIPELMELRELMQEGPRIGVTYADCLKSVEENGGLVEILGVDRVPETLQGDGEPQGVADGEPAARQGQTTPERPKIA